MVEYSFDPFAHMCILSSMIFLDICFMVGAVDAVRGDVLGEGSGCAHPDSHASAVSHGEPFGSGVRVGLTHVDNGSFFPMMLRKGALDGYVSSRMINYSAVTPGCSVVSKDGDGKYVSLDKFFPRSSGASSTPPPTHPRTNLSTPARVGGLVNS